jgi:hypothetical protein
MTNDAAGGAQPDASSFLRASTFDIRNSRLAFVQARLEWNASQPGARTEVRRPSPVRLWAALLAIPAGFPLPAHGALCCRSVVRILRTLVPESRTPVRKSRTSRPTFCRKFSGIPKKSCVPKNKCPVTRRYPPHPRTIVLNRRTPARLLRRIAPTFRTTVRKSRRCVLAPIASRHPAAHLRGNSAHLFHHSAHLSANPAVVLSGVKVFS